MMMPPVGLFNYLIHILAFVNFANAALDLTKLQQISGFSDECTSAYEQPIDQCPNARSFVENGGCNKRCFEALNAASLTIQAACQSAAAFGGSLISHAFMGDLSVFLCGNAFDKDSNSAPAENAATTSPPDSPLITKTSSPSPPPPIPSTTSTLTDAQSTSTTTSTISTSSSLSTSSTSSTLDSTTSTEVSTTEAQVPTTIAVSSSSTAAPTPTAKPNNRPKDSTPMDPGISAGISTFSTLSSSILNLQLMTVTCLTMVLPWLLFS